MNWIKIFCFIQLTKSNLNFFSSIFMIFLRLSLLLDCYKFYKSNFAILYLIAFILSFCQNIFCTKNVFSGSHKFVFFNDNFHNFFFTKNQKTRDYLQFSQNGIITTFLYFPIHDGFPSFYFFSLAAERKTLIHRIFFVEFLF